MGRIVTSAAAIALVALAAWLLGPRGAAAAVALAFLVVVWRHDNESGACLPLAVLLLLAVVAMVLLIFMLMLIAPR
jgi:hypothetical protein